MYLGGRSGLRAHPHFAHWAELRALFSDGVAMARSGGQGTRREVGGAPRQPLLGGGSSDHRTDRVSGDKGKGKSKSSANKSSKGSSTGSDVKDKKRMKGGEQEHEHEKKQQGRWVHVPTI